MLGARSLWGIAVLSALACCAIPRAHAQTFKDKLKDQVQEGLDEAREKRKRQQEREEAEKKAREQADKNAVTTSLIE